MSRLIIGITDGRKYENYHRWFIEVPGVEVLQLSHAKNNAHEIKKCNGLVLTGGEDVHPDFYNKPEYVEQYKLTDFNKNRDAFELEVLTHSQQLPMLGICRGLQLVNVFFGGTLIPDIPWFGKPDHSKYEEGRDRYHTVNVEKGTLLEKLSGTTGEVNSAHHQGVDTPGNGLIINALSEDGTIEGMERAVKNDHPFLLLVQWHPERMINQQSMFSKTIRDSFIKSL